MCVYHSTVKVKMSFSISITNSNPKATNYSVTFAHTSIYTHTTNTRLYPVPQSIHYTVLRSVSTLVKLLPHPKTRQTPSRPFNRLPKRYS